MRPNLLKRALFVMKADGAQLHRITPWNLNGGDNPDWAPDGSRILFRSNVEVSDERSQFYSVRPDGTHLTQISHFPFTRRRLFSASYSPDGRLIVFAKADSQGARRRQDHERQRDQSSLGASGQALGQRRRLGRHRELSHCSQQLPGWKGGHHETTHAHPSDGVGDRAQRATGHVTEAGAS